MDEAISNMNKVELHRHFEGCITPTIFHNLIKKNHPDKLEAISENLIFNFGKYLRWNISLRFIKNNDKTA